MRISDPTGEPMNRRQLLSLAGGSLTGLAGCLGGQIRASNDATTGTNTPTTTQSPRECFRELHPMRIEYAVADGPVDGFELRVEPETVPIGGSVTVTLENVTSQTRSTGPKAKYDIQRRDEGNWTSIFQVGRGGWVSPLIGHRPGDGFTWTLEMTPEGLTVTDRRWDQACYVVTEPLTPGTYRFVYWGVSLADVDESVEEDGIAETFSVTEG